MAKNTFEAAKACHMGKSLSRGVAQALSRGVALVALSRGPSPSTSASAMLPLENAANLPENSGDLLAFL